MKISNLQLLSRYSLRLLGLLVGLLPAACQSGGGVVERLDRDSGLTIVTDPEWLVFARTEGRYSRSARDYVYLAPMEINERGARQYYLWVGIASTIDRPFLEASIMTPDTLFLELAGAPVEFELKPWDEALPPLSAFEAYDAPVTPTIVLVARITVDQLLLLAGQELPGIRVAARDAPSTEYVLWEQRSPWTTFANYID
jgi:hypothetical protein